MAYDKQTLRDIFQSHFDISTWTGIIKNLFKAQGLRREPERIDNTPDNTEGYYIGALDTGDNYHIGFFHYKVEGNVRRRRVGLRRLVRSFTNPNWGVFDTALAVFDNGDDWRLSLISDIKGEETAPKRFTFVFGDRENRYNTPIDRFLRLQGAGISYRNIKEAFSVEALTKEFYKELFDWYQWAMDPQSNVSFPNDTSTEADDKEGLDTKIIRLITRLMFVWFIKQKNLVPACLFNEEELQKTLKGFDSRSATDGSYYNAILQNLFFATLNRAITDDNGQPRRFAHNQGKDAKTLYRYDELFNIPEDEVVRLFAGVPFLNGGLFDCLDKTKTLDGVEHAYYYDGFSRNGSRFADGRYKYRATVPNRLFFDPERGLLSLLKRYNFTIEENSPEEQQVALDPELLGKVFENLLGAYNPETKETARKQSGSFYTPREIVNYMVDESLMAYLGKTRLVEQLFSDGFEKEERHEEEYRQIADKLKNVKVLDPACGSGAFPMGMLARITELLQRLQPEEDTYNLKLRLIENCLYGCDIQGIAAQITKLRFFISLVCDCEKDPNKPNFGIPTLPNLETKFVTADSLIGIIKQSTEPVLMSPEIESVKKELADVRHKHFNAKTVSEKKRLRGEDEELRKKLSRLLQTEGLFTSDIAEQVAQWNPYDQNAVASFFDPEWMFGITGGFDIVIGNPPYIQLQNNNGELARKYEKCGYGTFARTGDIYCLFYERGWQLLKQQGHLCYITSNKWMRAGYGEKTRDFLARKTDPQLLIDFAGVQIFESATVDVNILLLEKATNRHRTVCAITNRENMDGLKKLDVFVQQEGVPCDFSSSGSWVILSPIERGIKEKIEKAGTPLKDWDIQINYGIKTGCNEAFIIPTSKRDEILSHCASDDERKRTEELIRPILRGKDIKRYGYDWKGRWLIATFPSRHYNIDDYPAVKEYLTSFGIERLEQTGKTHVVDGVKIKARKKTNNKWFETQDSIGYWQDFSKPKICWKAVGRNLTFAIVEPGTFLTAPASFISAGDFNYYILGFLCSQVAKYFIFQNSDTTGAGDIMLNIQSLIKFPVPINKNTGEIDALVKELQQVYSDDTQAKLNRLIYSIYGFDIEEIKKIERI